MFKAACSQWRQTTPELLMCKIWITSNFSTQFLTAALRPALAIRNILAEVNESGYNQWESVLHDPQHPIFQMKPDIILLLLSSMELAFRGDTTPEAVTERIFSAIQAAKRNGNARIVVTLPEPLQEEYLSNSWAYEWRRRICTSLHERVAPDDAVLVDMEPLIRRVGGDAWFSAKYYITAKFPFHPDHTHLYANTLADVVRGILSSPCKMIITDLDNTLWRGIVGEVGWENVDLDEGGKGHSFLRIQRFLKHLQRSGVLLAIVSKNQPEIALEVFRRSEMILQEKDFIAKEINWERKSQNIRRILQRLNLSTAGVVFLDDSPVEREEVRSAIPNLIVPELPSEPAEWVPMLQQMGLFECGFSTLESVRRKQYYEEEHRRQAELDSIENYETFLRKLDIKLTPIEIAENRERVVELINKTNQFNLTTRRFGWSRIEEILSRGGLAFSYRLEDRFGDYGIISVVVLEVEEKNKFRIDTWVMSCRVMGRTVEHAILSHVLHELKQRGTAYLVGEFIPSPKNAPVASLYEKLGFQEKEPEGDSVFYEIEVALAAKERLNRYVTIVSSLTEERKKRKCEP